MADLQIVLASKNIEAQYVEMMVPLYSFGCEKKVKKALSHLRGIHSIHVDQNLQKATVWGICNKDDVLAAIRKKRREARFWDEKEAIDDTTKTEVKTGLETDEEAARTLRRSYKFHKSWKKMLLVFTISKAFQVDHFKQRLGMK